MPIKFQKVVFNLNFVCCVSGIRCTEDVDECTQRSEPCKNGGTCSNHQGGYQCICVNGWTGTYCQENIDDCISKPCYNGGTCIDLVGYYKCECPPGKTGKNVIGASDNKPSATIWFLGMTHTFLVMKVFNCIKAIL